MRGPSRRTQCWNSWNKTIMFGRKLIHNLWAKQMRLASKVEQNCVITIISVSQILAFKSTIFNKACLKSVLLSDNFILGMSWSLRKNKSKLEKKDTFSIYFVGYRRFWEYYLSRWNNYFVYRTILYLNKKWRGMFIDVEINQLNCQFSCDISWAAIYLTLFMCVLMAHYKSGHHAR